MSRNTILALCVVALLAGLAWAATSGQSLLVMTGIVLGMAVLAAITWLVTAGSAGRP